MTKTREYLVYRRGSNAANQSMRQVAPVAIVTAATANEACAETAPERPDLWSCRRLALAPDVTLWANQTAYAVPVSRAPARDLREVEEADPWQP